MTSFTGSFRDMSARLHHAAPQLLAISGHTRAAVALILKKDASGYHILFIERASHPEDPWSGNIGFPGGKVEEQDADARTAAERETREEIGIDLPSATYLGYLDDFGGAHLPVLLSCFLYGYEQSPPEIAINHEVKDVFWVSFDDLIDPARQGNHSFFFAGDLAESPCITLPVPDKPVLWGLTYRMVMEFFAILGIPCEGKERP